MPNHRGCWLRIARRIIDSLCHLLPSTVYRIKPFSLTIQNRILRCDYRCGLRFKFTIHESKGKTRLVPFGEDLSIKLSSYRKENESITLDNNSLWVRRDGRRVPVDMILKEVRELFRHTGLKPSKGRTGPRPYDLRHYIPFRIMSSKTKNLYPSLSISGLWLLQIYIYPT